MHACTRARVLACLRTCVLVCLRACVLACLCACVSGYSGSGFGGSCSKTSFRPSRSSEQEEVGRRRWAGGVGRMKGREGAMGENSGQEVSLPYYFIGMLELW